TPVLYALLALRRLPCHVAHRDQHPFPTRRSSDLTGVDRDVLVVESVGAAADGDHITGFGQVHGMLHGGEGVVEASDGGVVPVGRSEEHTSELQSRFELVCRLLREEKKRSTAVGTR